MKKLSVLAFAAILLTFSAINVRSQSIISGDVTGTVTDATGAVLPNATVTLKNNATGVTQSATTNSQGVYRFALVPPGLYTVSASAKGFQTSQVTNVRTTAGQASPADLQLAVANATQTVNVTESATSVQTENADVSTVYNTEQVLNMPNPGGDLTYIAQTTPGVTMNTQSGYGNFSAFGMPATSNLFTVNGQNFNDPYLNLNNSGASNLMLGFNDIAEASVVNNAYSAQYGQYAGSQVTYTTKTGSNAFHGDAIYMWNGRALNANDFFSNSAGAPTPFVNFNQWATGIQGPIWKNHTFFDVDYEGVRVVLPTSSALVRIPSPQFEAATLANLGSNGNAAEIPFYQQLFNVYNGASGASSATPVTTSNNGCGTFTALGAGVPCALQFRTTPPNSEHEYQWAARVDHNFSDRDRGYIRVFRDNGYQPTYTDVFNPIFNAYSPQPQMSGQVSETHTFGSTAVNQFNGSALFYSAAFLPSDLSGATALVPAPVAFIGAPFSRVGGAFYAFPQGRRVFQYQIIDDFSKVAGKHTFRAGFSWLHDNVTELGFGENVNGYVHTTLPEFYAGGGPTSYIEQNFPSATEQPFAFNTFGGYIMDDWKVSDRLTISLNLRLENYSNPTCAHNCFARLTTPFTGAAANPNTPYNQLILSNQHNAYPDTPMLSWEPRAGIAWRPFNSDKTVIRTGAGIFADELPGNLAQAAAFNTPGLNAFTIAGGALAPGVGGSLFTTASQANQALLSQFASGGTLASITQAVPGFTPPNITSFPSKFQQPTYYKWNFEVQQALGWKTVLSVNYAGMHGVHIPIADGGLNAYCPPSACPGGFAGLPASAPDPALGTVTQYIAGGVSSYNGLIVSLRRQLSAGFTFDLSYTWSHALDEISNGGIEPFSYLSTNPSILYPQNPYDIKANYGNADQDVRHYASLGWVMTDMFRHAGMHWGPNRVFGGWTLSGNFFARSGLPFTVIDNNATGTLAGFNYLGTVFATPLNGTSAVTCDRSAVNTPCLSTSQFATSTGSPTGFGIQGRNEFRGPSFFDMDLALMKDIQIKERLTFSFGAQAFNLLNHPNFDQPVGDIANPSFGSITSLVGPPTSILGAFVGGNNSPRFVEIKGVLRF